MNKVPQRICQVLAITALSFGLAACDKNPSDKTPGQKLDTAIADTKQAAQDTGQAIQQGADQAGAKIAEGAQQAGAATGAALEQAGQKVEAAADKAGAALDDSGITALVKTRLIGDPDIKALAIDVTTKDGVVTLTGSAPTDAAKTQATTLAGGVEGVKSVVNDLRVVPQ